MGAALSLGSPLGAALLRVLSGEALPAELSRNWPFYAYMSVGTLLAFTAFGWVLGRTADRLAGDRRALLVANRRLRRISRIDALTGLLNRGTIDLRLQEEILRARRQATPLSAIMLDIDHFKRVNDGHGHSRGDDVLRELAARVRQAARATDVVGRFGGEEFLLLLPQTAREEAELLAERVRAYLAESPVAGLAITASLGVATCPPGDVLSAAELVERADTALYRAKDAGRNRVVAFN